MHVIIVIIICPSHTHTHIVIHNYHVENSVLSQNMILGDSDVTNIGISEEVG